MVSPSQTPAFREVQRLGGMWWVTLIVFGVGVFAWVGFVLQIVLGRPFGTKPAPDWAMWLLWLLFGIGLPVLWNISKLVVEVTDDYIFVQYVPFVTTTISYTDIKGYEARSYRPIREYGGWGIRWAPGKRRAYNVRGNKGVELELLSGQRIMIGSQRPEELVHAIDSRSR